MRHTEFGKPSQCFSYEIISERCKSKSYTILWENKFSAPNFSEIEKFRLFKNHICQSTSFFPIISCHDWLCAHRPFASCTLAKRWCTHQLVNAYRKCLKQYLICPWLYRSQHDKFKKHGFELKLLFSVFSKLVTKSKLIKQVWSCKPIWYCKYSVNPWIQSKLRLNVYENVKLWKLRVSIFFTFYCKPSGIEAERQMLI